MKLKTILGWSAALCLGATIARAQQTNQPADFAQRLNQMQERFEKRQQEMQEEFERKISAQDAEIEALKRQLAGTAPNPPPAAVTGAPPANLAGAPEAVSPEKFKELDEKVNAVIEAQKKTLMSEFNPAIGFVGETIFSEQCKGSPQNGTGYPGGFDVFQRSVELNASASVDPFAKGWVVINGSADASTGETSLDVEEAALQTTSLPGNMTLTAGQFFGEYGRLSYIHDHELPFVNRPMVLDQYIHGESKTAGVQASWLLPVEHYVNLTAGLGTQFGDSSDAVGGSRSFGEVNYFGRLSTYFDLSPNWQLECGVSSLVNPDAGNVDAQLAPNGITTLTETRRLVLDGDLKLSYVPLRGNQFNSLTWGNEVLYSDNHYRATPVGGGSSFADNVGAWGMYSYLTWKWSRSWSAGFLFEFLQNDQNSSARTYGYSPYLTWAISHWNQLRLQYTHTQPNAATGNEPNDAVYLQWTWIIGSHSHGWQQR
jgi:hypothetical protein